jgi:hypothetical protein
MERDYQGYIGDICIMLEKYGFSVTLFTCLFGTEFKFCFIPKLLYLYTLLVTMGKMKHRNHQKGKLIVIRIIMHRWR